MSRTNIPIKAARATKAIVREAGNSSKTNSIKLARLTFKTNTIAILAKLVKLAMLIFETNATRRGELANLSFKTKATRSAIAIIEIATTRLARLVNLSF